MKNQGKVKVLFVCMGNICRSPTAQGVFDHLLKQQGCSGRIKTDSAGTHAYHVGEAPDSRAQQAALKRGVDISDLQARKVNVDDFIIFDYILAMDSDNYRYLKKICPIEQQHKIEYFLNYAADVSELEVPDPYYGGVKGFERVLNLVEAAALGLLEHIQRSYQFRCPTEYQRSQSG